MKGPFFKVHVPAYPLSFPAYLSLRVHVPAYLSLLVLQMHLLLTSYFFSSDASLAAFASAPAAII
jgi:hypothetical protein